MTAVAPKTHNHQVDTLTEPQDDAYQKDGHRFKKKNNKKTCISHLHFAILTLNVKQQIKKFPSK